MAELSAAGKTARVTVEVLQSKSNGARSWFSIGPDGSEVPHVGRMNALAFGPHNPSTLYAGSARGGVWKSPDRGGTWWPMMDNKSMPSVGVATLAVASNGTVYAGLGDPKINVSGFQETASTAGVVKSNDGGVTWRAVNPIPCAPTATRRCPSPCANYTGFPNRLVVDPGNPSRIYVADGNGVFAADGRGCWRQIFNSAATDLVLDPSSNSTLYVGASGTGVVKLTGITGTPTAVSTLPFLQQQIALALAPSNPDVAYALGSTGGTAFLIRTNDRFKTLESSSKAPCAGQCTRLNPLAVDPKDANHVFYGNIGMAHSTDGGLTFNQITYAASANHDDQLAFAFAPDDATLLYVANDGGVYRLSVPSIGQRDFEPRTLGLAVGQVAGLSSAPTDRHLAAIGTWDTSTQRRVTGRRWEQIGPNSDGFAVTIDAASDHSIFYNWNAVNDGRFVRYRDGQGSGFLGNAAGISCNPFLPGELFEVKPASTADNRLYLVEDANDPAKFNALDQGMVCADPTPTPTPSPAPQAFSLEFAPGGAVYLSNDRGNLFTFTITKPVMSFPKCSSGTNAQPVNPPPIYTDPAPRPGVIIVPAADPFDATRVYAVVPIQTGANRVRVVTGVNQSQSIVGNLPASVALTGAIAADPVRRGIVYLGSRRGLWEGVPDSSGAYRWAVASDIPDTIVTNIVHQRNSNGYSARLRVAAFGRGVWEAAFRPPVSRKSAVSPAESSASGICLTCGAWRDPMPSGGSDSGARDAVVLAVPYTYRGEAGPFAHIRAVFLSKGAEQPFFVSEAKKVNVGEGTIPLLVALAAESAPTGVHTDAVRFEIFSATKDGAVVAESTIPFDHWWARPEARVVRVVAESESHGRIPVSATIEVDGRPIEGSTPLVIPVKTGSRLKVRIREQVEVAPVFKDDLKAGKPIRERLDRWSLNGRTAPARADLTASVDADTTVIAHYGRSRSEQQPKDEPGRGPSQRPRDRK